ncbi:MAG: tripartite tricarboxylate transporter substrate binding protein [Betaproteobacteria bacterium]|nr:tripartite tricarboxylate transporter substrate binding protein [Betaproteobacteria bacterium]
MRLLRFHHLTAAALVAVLIFAPGSWAQGYPVKPVRIVLPFLGGTDFVGRWLAHKLTPALGHQAIVEPRLGAGGNIAHESVARAPADGYTLLMAAPTFVINPHLSRKASFDPLKDFAPVALLAFIPNVLVVHPSVPAGSLGELQQLARRYPGKLSFGSGGVNSATHLAGEMLKQLTKSEIVHIPYKSATLALVGAATGDVDIVIAAVPVIAPHVHQKRLRPLAVLDAKRVASLPGVPTSAEAGVPQLKVVFWYVLLAPAGTPREIIERLSAESMKTMRAADTRERFATIGADTVSRTPEQTAAFLRNEHARWGKLIRDAGIKAD